MKKSIAACAFLAAMGTFSTSAFAAPLFDGSSDTVASFTPTITPSKVLNIAVSNELKHSGTIPASTKLFTLNVSADPAANIALAAADTGTQIRSGGLVISEADLVKGTVMGYLSSGQEFKLDNDPSFKPDGAPTGTSQYSVLLKGSDMYVLDVTTAADYNNAEGSYTNPGTYVFKFIAQAYSE